MPISNSNLVYTVEETHEPNLSTGVFLYDTLLKIICLLSEILMMTMTMFTMQRLKQDFCSGSGLDNVYNAKTRAGFLLR